MHFAQWDEDKYAELSKFLPYQLPLPSLMVNIRNFLLNNYEQVEVILTEIPTMITALQSGKSPENTAYSEHLNTECVYLASLKKEPKAHIFGCQYISLLLKYSQAE